MVKEGDLMGLEICDDIYEKASLFLEISLHLEEMNEKLKERATEVGLKEESLKERSLVLEELEKSVTLRLEELEKENEVKQSLASCLMRLVIEKQEEEAMEKLELVSKLVDEKSFELDRSVKEFDLKQKVSIDRRRNEAEVVRLLDKALRERVAEFEKKKEIFEEEKKAEAEETEEKRKYLELKEKKLEEMEKELELKQREFQERPVERETVKRSRVKLLAEKCSEVDNLPPPLKRHKSSHNRDDRGKGKELACLGSVSENPNEGETDEGLLIGDTVTNEESEEEVTCVDSQFHVFEPELSPSMVGKVWALYDPLDAMPRLYARVKSVNKSRLSVDITWLNAKDEELVPVACGKFELGKNETMSYFTLSHEMHRVIHGRYNIAVNPRIGETWALFRDWSNNPEQHKAPFKYDIVEVISFEDGLVPEYGVTYLKKVEGFVSVFDYATHNGVVSRVIAPEEMGRFSHRVPSVSLSGEEKEGVPAGSFELDPAAVPSSLLKPDHSIHEEEAEEPERQSEECAETCEVEVQVEDGSTKDIPIILD